MPAAFRYILMRIAVNGLSLLPTPTGAGQYARQLFPAMKALAAPPKITFFHGLNWSRAMAEARAPALDPGWRLGWGMPGRLWGKPVLTCTAAC